MLEFVPCFETCWPIRSKGAVCQEWLISVFLPLASAYWWEKVHLDAIRTVEQEEVGNSCL